MTSSRELIRSALERLLERSANSSVTDPGETPKEAMDASVKGYRYFPFVVFEDRKTGRFVQFTGDRGRLLLDLPLPSLSPQERTWAAEIFPVLGADSPSVTQLYTYPSGELGDLLATYQVPFRGDVASAASAALDVFSHVFRTAEADLDLSLQEE
jgi:hypothetical protein